MRIFGAFRFTSSAVGREHIWQVLRASEFNKSSERIIYLAVTSANDTHDVYAPTSRDVKSSVFLALSVPFCLKQRAQELGVLKGQLSRWLLPYDADTSVEEQQAATPRQFQEKLQESSSVPSGGNLLTESEAEYLTAEARRVRQLVRRMNGHSHLSSHVDVWELSQSRYRPT